MLRVFWNHLLISMQHRRKSGRAASKEGIVFIDYLAHLQEPALDGAFRSNYWGPLVKLLEDWPEPVNWLHISATYATPTVIRSDVDKCEVFNEVHPTHILLHSYLDLRTVGQAFRDYVRIRQFGKKLWKQADVFVEAETGLNPFPLLHNLIQDQFFGRTAALNALSINLWESAMHALAKQRLGIYLFENQPWELAFLSAWQESHLGKTLAVAHSTMRFWDLRYFPGGDVSTVPGRPTPNSVVVNGPLMKATALNGGYPERMLTVAESLRSQEGVSTRDDDVTDLLVLGEYEVGHDHDIIETAKRFADSLEPPPRVTYRPHPTTEIDPRSMPNQWSLSKHTSVNAAIAACRIALCGPSTSAALDARLNGKSVVIVGLADVLISSPAFGLPDVHLVTTGSHAEPLRWSSLTKATPLPNANYLTISDQLQRWRTLLSRSENG